jgi:hypothetical protein
MEKKYSRIDIIGQNGNEGTHYGESGPMEFSHTPTPTPTPPCVGHSVASDDAIELEAINKILEYVKEDGLITEVVYYALREMQQDPTLSPSEAIQFAYSEWIK